jgi:uncharacterized protein
LTEPDPTSLLARELVLPPASVAAVRRLLAEGNTVPFIARYRKEATGSLDEVAIRAIEERGAYLEELEARRKAILESLEEQGALTDDLRRRLAACSSKAELEDLYLPYRPKRRTRATLARERGLEPLALRLLAQGLNARPEDEARAFAAPEQGVPDVAAALAGARDIVAERLAEDPDLRALARDAFRRRGEVVSRKARKAPDGPSPYQDYHAFREAARSVPSHRYLAMRRGEAEGALTLSITLPEDALLPIMLRHARLDRRSPWATHLEQAARDGLERLLAPAMETELHAEMKARADDTAIGVFASNLRPLLLAAPYGSHPVVGVDPGLRTGCKCAALDATGRFLGHLAVFPHTGDAARATRDFLAFLERHRPEAVAIGNGTAGRETEAWVRAALKEAGEAGVLVVSVSESGASVYSASEVAREEFPQLDLTVRGAISIARRLQDPLAELVKVDPQAIGVGQYQHDVEQKRLKQKLDEVVESVVNTVGVDLDTASASLLAHVAGIGPALARSLVAFREAHGAFLDRRQLLNVPKLGPRAFEQCAGFLRIRGGRQALDASAVHPERYPLVERMATDLGVPVGRLVGDAELAARLDLRRYLGDGVGEPTLRDILAELARPGRDPRASFEPPAFREDVTRLEDVQPGMLLEGVVTNVAAFGAFVDLGVHQDGLVHVSQLADRFVRDPHEVVHVGQRLTVRVLEVDLARRRISLSCRKS